MQQTVMPSGHRGSGRGVSRVAAGGGARGAGGVARGAGGMSRSMAAGNLSPGAGGGMAAMPPGLAAGSSLLDGFLPRTAVPAAAGGQERIKSLLADSILNLCR